MSEAQAEKPAVVPENSQPAGQDKPQADDSGLNAQQKKEYMTLKQKAEDYNKLERRAAEAEARLAQMERLAVSQGAQATDPMADDIAALREAAAYDPAARITLKNLEMTARAQAEMGLIDSTAHLPASKREQVRALIRNSVYQMDADTALSLVTDPDTKTKDQRLEELEAENKRLKERATKPSGVSPSTTQPASDASASTDVENMPWSEAQAILRDGGSRAKVLRDKMDSRGVKIDYAR